MKKTKEIEHQQEPNEVQIVRKMPKMKFFRKFRATCSEEMKRKKHYIFEQFRVDKRDNEEAYVIDSILKTQQTSFKCVRKIEWIRDDDKTETDREFKTLTDQVTKTSKTLETLKIDLSGCPISDEGVHILTSQIRKNFKLLQHLQLNLAYLNKLTDKGFKDLATQIQKSSHKLKLLDLDLSRGAYERKENLKEEILKDFVTRFGKNHTSLQHLRLTLKYRSTMTDEVLMLLATHIEKDFPNLQNMDLCFYRTSLTDQGIINLASQFRNSFQKLSFLKLDFYQNKIHDEGAKELATQILLNLKELRKLELNFAYNKNVTDKGVIGLAGVLRDSSKTLLSLKLDFHSCGITDASLAFLGAQIATHLKSLQELSLFFSSCEITDQGVEEIVDNIGQNLDRLENITLEFGFNQGVTTKAAKAIGTLLGNKADTLRSIRLDFSGCYSLTSEGIVALTCHEFKSLHHFHLDFLDVSRLHDDKTSTLIAKFFNKHRKTLKTFIIDTVSFTGWT